MTEKVSVPEIRIKQWPLYVTREPLSNLDPEDPIFHGFTGQYINFKSWFRYLGETGKQAWVYSQDNRLLGFLLLEEEDHIPGAVPPLENIPRLNISKMKISTQLPVILDLFLKIAVKEALARGIDELYFTCFPSVSPEMIRPLLEFGFLKTARKTNNEDIYIKRLKPPAGQMAPGEINRLHYPSFYDGVKVKKYILPVSAVLHKQLFTDTDSLQPNLFENAGEVFVDGNTIKKALLIRDKHIGELSPGDILLIYRRQDMKAITSLCVVEKTDTSGQTITDRLLCREEKKGKARQESLILFRWHFHLPVYPDTRFLTKENILGGPPSSLTRIDERKYSAIMQRSGLDNSYRVS